MQSKTLDPVFWVTVLYIYTVYIELYPVWKSEIVYQ